jgi:hypothetical protein
MGRDCHIIKDGKRIGESLGRWEVFRYSFEGHGELTKERALSSIKDLLTANKIERNSLIDAQTILNGIEGKVQIVPDD